MNTHTLALLVGLLLLQVMAQRQSVDVRAYRAQLRVQSEQMVGDHNARRASYKMRLYDRFAEMSEEELTAHFTSHIEVSSSGIKTVEKVRPAVRGQHDVDWRKTQHKYGPNGEKQKKYWLTSVKNQGMCGACYSYAAISDIETTYLFKDIELDLSEQHVTDCSDSFSNYGCSGGWMGNVFAFAMLRGIHTEEKYPLSGFSWLTGKTPQCQLNEQGQFRIRRYAYVSYRTNDCAALTMILSHRPVTAPLAISKEFFFYGEGVLDTCGTELNHGVVVVGVTERDGQNYWLVKNSWGTEWGQEGYVRIDRSQKEGNLCGICFTNVYSVI